MKAPSLVIGFKGEAPSVIYCGADAGKAKQAYEAGNSNAELDGVMLIIRPEYTRRNRPAKHIERAKLEAAELAAKKAAEEEEKKNTPAEPPAPAEPPKRKATK